MNVPQILFSIGIAILIYVNINNKPNRMWLTASTLFIICAWITKYIDEKYSYNWAKRSGKLVGGTVFTSYPENVPGLGWI